MGRSSFLGCESPKLFADPPRGYCARIGPSHLIWCGARRGGERWWTSGWPSRRWSSSCVDSSERAGDATAGKVVPPDGHDLSAEPLSSRRALGSLFPSRQESSKNTLFGGCAAFSWGCRLLVLAVRERL